VRRNRAQVVEYRLAETLLSKRLVESAGRLVCRSCGERPATVERRKKFRRNVDNLVPQRSELAG
jgi:hypothetical protein